MKKVYILFALTFAFINVFAAKRIKGYYISRSNDTVQVDLKIPFLLLSDEPSYLPLQGGVTYYDVNGKTASLRPSAILEVGFEFAGKKTRLVSVHNNLELVGSVFRDNSYIFLRIINDGKLKLYKYYRTQQTGGGAYTVEINIFKKENKELFQTDLFFFRKDLISYLYDCNTLVQKLSDKVYGSDDADEIVNYYNMNCP